MWITGNRVQRLVWSLAMSFLERPRRYVLLKPTACLLYHAVSTETLNFLTNSCLSTSRDHNSLFPRLHLWGKSKGFQVRGPHFYTSHKCNLQALQVFGTCLGTRFVESILRVKAAKRKAESRNQGRVPGSSFESQVQLCVKQD